MNCNEISTQLGFRCKPVGDGLLYVQSPLALSFDGQLIGAFVQEIGRGLVRITDNADILFCAMSHGLTPNAKRSQKFSTIAAESGFSISEAGELHAVCPKDLAGYQLARFIEVASRLGDACDDALVPHVSKFERLIGSVLARGFEKRLKRSVTLRGASGHQLAFPFVIDVGLPGQTVIQTIASGRGGKPNWGSVYGTVGKMGDLKNSGDRSKRTVVLQQGDPEVIQQACVALAEHASIIIYESRDQLLKTLQAA